MTTMTITHITHIARRMFLRNTADPDLPNFWIAEAKAIQANLTRTSRIEPGQPQHPVHHAIKAR
jgi:hypothetical protein